MKLRKWMQRAVWLCGLSVLVIAVGCGQQAADTTPESDTSQPVAATTPVTVTPDMEAILAKADAVDGSTDKVVSKCPVCALGMDGSDKNSLAVGDYCLHFCSDHCKKDFQTDIAQSVLAIQFPSE